MKHNAMRSVKNYIVHVHVDCTINQSHDIYTKTLLTLIRTVSTVSMCHRLLGEYLCKKLMMIVHVTQSQLHVTHFSATVSTLETMYALNSGSQTSRKASSSLTMEQMFASLMRAKESSSARRRIDMSFSFRQSKMVFL